MNILSQCHRHRFSKLVMIALFTCGISFIAIGNVSWLEAYGYGTFIGVPLACGIFGGSIKWRENSGKADIAALVAVFCLIAVGGFMLLFGVEGLVCIAMMLPFALTLLAFGLAIGFLARFIVSFFIPDVHKMIIILSITPFITGVEQLADLDPPVYKVTTCIMIAAPSETVWKHVVTFPKLDEPTEWLFRAGIAYPVHATIQGEGEGAIRRCVFNTGEFVEPVEVWDPPRLLRFAVTDNPPPMTELALYESIDPAHLHGYMVAKRGQFELVPQPDGATQIQGTTWYSHGLYPAWYWRLWSDQIIHRIHGRVLEHIKELAEADFRGSRLE